MNYTVSDSHSSLTPEEFIELSKSVGWGVNRVYDMEKVAEALRNTKYIVTVRDTDGILIGCGRALSDDLLFTTIPDVFIRPEYQKQGLGRVIMEKLRDRFIHTSIFFGSQPGNEPFFEKLGFTKGLQSYSYKRR